MSMPPQPALMFWGFKGYELDVHATASNLRAAACEHAATRTFIDAWLCKVGHIAEQIVELGLQAAGQGRCRSAGRTDRKCRQQQSLLEVDFFHRNLARKPLFSDRGGSAVLLSKFG